MNIYLRISDFQVNFYFRFSHTLMLKLDDTFQDTEIFRSLYLFIQNFRFLSWEQDIFKIFYGWYFPLWIQEAKMLRIQAWSKVKRYNLFPGFTDNVTIGLILRYLVFVNSIYNLEAAFNLHQIEFGNSTWAVNFRNLNIKMNRNPTEIAKRDD